MIRNQLNVLLAFVERERHALDGSDDRLRGVLAELEELERELQRTVVAFDGEVESFVSVPTSRTESGW